MDFCFCWGLYSQSFLVRKGVYLKRIELKVRGWTLVNALSRLVITYSKEETSNQQSKVYRRDEEESVKLYRCGKTMFDWLLDFTWSVTRSENRHISRLIFPASLILGRKGYTVTRDIHHSKSTRSIVTMLKVLEIFKTKPLYNFNSKKLSTYSTFLFPSIWSSHSMIRWHSNLFARKRNSPSIPIFHFSAESYNISISV